MMTLFLAIKVLHNQRKETESSIYTSIQMVCQQQLLNNAIQYKTAQKVSMNYLQLGNQCQTSIDKGVLAKHRKATKDTAQHAWPRDYKSFFMLNSTEHEIFPAHKC